MPKRKLDDDDDRREPDAIMPVPTITTVETDVRVRLRIDISQLFPVGGGEPTPEQLQALVVHTVEQVFRSKAFVLEAHAGYLDVEFEVRKLDPERARSA